MPGLAGHHTSPSLDELIVAAARGDEAAFRRLYERTVDTLFGVALRIVRRADWAEEVVQEGFVSVWRHAGRFDRSKGAAMTWLIRIVRNQALDWIEPRHADGHERLHGVNVDALGDEGFDALGLEAEDDPPGGLDFARSAARIGACLEALDARQRQSIVLVFFHGLSHGDLARHLQQPLGTVKAWVRRGLKSLRGCLAVQA